MKKIAMSLVVLSAMFTVLVPLAGAGESKSKDKAVDDTKRDPIPPKNCRTECVAWDKDGRCTRTAEVCN